MHVVQKRRLFMFFSGLVFTIFENSYFSINNEVYLQVILRNVEEYWNLAG